MQYLICSVAPLTGGTLENLNMEPAARSVWPKQRLHFSYSSSKQPKSSGRTCLWFVFIVTGVHWSMLEDICNRHNFPLGNLKEARATLQRPQLARMAPACVELLRITLNHPHYLTYRGAVSRPASALKKASSDPPGVSLGWITLQYVPCTRRSCRR